VTARALRLAAGLSAWLLAAAVQAAAVAAPGEPPASAATEGTRCPPAAVALTQDQIQAGMRDAVDSGLLWKATKDGRAVYLYGTVHVARMAWIFPGPHVLKALMSSDVLALELDIMDPDILGRLQKAIARGPGTPVLPDALQRRLEARMAAACVEPATFAAMRPEMQAVTLEVLEGRSEGLYADYGIDVALDGMGHGLRKPVRSLETPESQAALLVSDDPAETARAVSDLLDELETGRSPPLLRRLAGDWQRGDLADLDAYASWCGCMDTPQQKADFVKLVDERNPLMADKVVKWHAEGKSLFVAVGSLHMVGPKGLPELLKARGFQVERVAFGTSH
jgi:uncharacterized protein YbaP (TraB family)